MLAAAMLGLDADGRAARLEAANIDVDAFDEAEQRHLRALAMSVSAGDDTLVEEHARNLRAQLEAPVPAAQQGPGDATQFPVVRAAAALPFSAIAGAALLSVPSRVDAEDAVDPSGETMPFGNVPAITLPFSAGGEMRFIRLETFAALSSALRRDPSRRVDILVREGFTSEESFQELASMWARRFEETPRLRVRFEELVAKKAGDQ